MIDNSCLLFNSLQKIRPLGSPKVSMWSVQNQYAHIPYLRFWFKETDIDDILYAKLKKTVQSFEGNMKWDMAINKDKAFKYFIYPEFFKDYIFTLGFDKENLLSAINESEYKRLIDLSINDIPLFAHYIEKVMLFESHSA